MTEERLEAIAKKIRESSNWLSVWAEVEELCKEAGLEEAWENADGEDFERVIERAAFILGVEIY